MNDNYGAKPYMQFRGLVMHERTNQGNEKSVSLLSVSKCQRASKTICCLGPTPDDDTISLLV